MKRETIIAQSSSKWLWGSLLLCDFVVRVVSIFQRWAQKCLYACRIDDFHCVLIWLPHRLEPHCARGVAHQDEIIRFFTPKIFTISISQLSTTNSYARHYVRNVGNSDIAIHRHFHISNVSHRRKFAENSMSSRVSDPAISVRVFHERFGFGSYGAWISITLWMMLGTVSHRRCLFFSSASCCIHSNQINWCSFNTRFVASTYLHKHDGFD